MSLIKGGWRHLKLRQKTFPVCEQLQHSVPPQPQPGRGVQRRWVTLGTWGHQWQHCHTPAGHHGRTHPHSKEDAGSQQDLIPGTILQTLCLAPDVGQMCPCGDPAVPEGSHPPGGAGARVCGQGCHLTLLGSQPCPALPWCPSAAHSQATEQTPRVLLLQLLPG